MVEGKVPLSRIVVHADSLNVDDVVVRINIKLLLLSRRLHRAL